MARQRSIALHVLGALMLVTSCAGPVWAQAVGPHVHWETRCAQCHGPVGDFARKRLSVVDAELRGSEPKRDLREFLRGHHVSSANVSTSLYEMLLTQAGTEARFQAECRACHGNAVDLVHRHYVVKEGVAYGRTSGSRLDKYLLKHRNLITEEDVPYFLELLRSVRTDLDPE